MVAAHTLRKPAGRRAAGAGDYRKKLVLPPERFLTAVPARCRGCTRLASFHARRAVGRNCDHWNAHRTVASRRASGAQAARRAQCANNVKQICLGLIQQHTATLHLPPGFLWPVGAVAQTQETETTWIFHMLPYVEEYALNYEISTNDGVGSFSSKNVPIMDAFISTFTCPTNPPVELVNESTFARGNYGANDGIGPMTETDYTSLPVTRPVKGVFYLNSSTRFKEFTDGLTKTVLIAELMAIPGQDFRGILQYPEGPLYQHNQTPNTATPDVVRVGWCITIPEAPCTTDPINFPSWKPRSLLYWRGSWHTTGVNVGMGDGSVQYVVNEIDLPLWQSVCTPAQVAGETLFLGFP